MSDIARVVDNGKVLIVFRNQLESYTALVVDVNIECILQAIEEAGEEHLTDAFTPDDSVSRVADKLFRVGDYSARRA